MFRVNRQTDYGVLLLTTFVVGQRAYTARELAERTGLSAPMVSKVLKLLTGEGLLTSQLGAKGGYSLACDPERVTVADIVQALEGPVAVTVCSDGEPGGCEQESWCPVRDHWQAINQRIQETLESTTLAQLAVPFSFPPRTGEPQEAPR